MEFLLDQQRYGILPDEINFSILHDVSLGLSANNVLLSTNMTAKISELLEY